MTLLTGPHKLETHTCATSLRRPTCSEALHLSRPRAELYALVDVVNNSEHRGAMEHRQAGPLRDLEDAKRTVLAPHLLCAR